MKPRKKPTFCELQNVGFRSLPSAVSFLTKQRSCNLSWLTDDREVMNYANNGSGGDPEHKIEATFRPLLGF
jgi:hypothetical protein